MGIKIRAFIAVRYGNLPLLNHVVGPLICGSNLTPGDALECSKHRLVINNMYLMLRYSSIKVLFFYCFSPSGWDFHIVFFLGTSSQVLVFKPFRLIMWRCWIRLKAWNIKTWGALPASRQKTPRYGTSLDISAWRAETFLLLSPDIQKLCNWFNNWSHKLLSNTQGWRPLKLLFSKKTKVI